MLKSRRSRDAFSAFLCILLVTPAAGAAERVPLLGGERAEAFAGRRRPVHFPGGASEPAAWLRDNAAVLRTTEPGGDDADLEPFRDWIGDARIVALGDGSHGTREFYRLKQRMVEFLVREMGFTAVAFEAPWPRFNRLNDYVLDGEGNPREILAADPFYFFWRSEEIVALVEWMRQYNLTRGVAPAVEIAGVDISYPPDLVEDVLAYVRAVDPAREAAVAAKLACLDAVSLGSDACAADLASVREDLERRREELEPRSTARRYREALQSVRMLEQVRRQYAGPGNVWAERDHAMAENVTWLASGEEVPRKVIYWAHNLHVSEGEVIPLSGYLESGVAPSGRYLADAWGDRYFTIATTTREGSFNSMTPRAGLEVKTIPPLPSDSIENDLARAGAPLLAVPLDLVPVPSWLVRLRPMLVITTVDTVTPAIDLGAYYDALIYVETTTPFVVIP